MVGSAAEQSGSRRATAWPGRALSVVTVSIALCLLILAVRADAPWVLRHLQLLDAHGPPAAWVPIALRAGLGLIAALLIFAALRLRRLTSWPSAGAALRVGVSMLLALPAAEGMLRLARSRRSEDRRTLHERLGEPHPRWGWRFKPGTSATVKLFGRDVPLAFDQDGSRIGCAGEAPDPAAPSLVIAGESMAMGHGLRWEETIAVRAARRLGLQPVNLAVNGYGVDQAFLRVRDLLPALKAPRIVVMVVLPIQLGRNLIDDHPRLSLSPSGELEVLPAAEGFLAGLQLRTLFVQRLPLRTEAEVQRTVALSSALLRKTAALARASGARLLFVVPSPGLARPGTIRPEAALVEEVFAAVDAPWIFVGLPAAERFPDGHPNAAGAQHLADAIASVLEEA